MPRKTDGDKLNDLEKFVAGMVKELEFAVKANQSLDADLRKSVELLNDLRRDSDREIALLKREVEELKRSRDRWSQRLWLVLAPLVAGAAGVALGLRK